MFTLIEVLVMTAWIIAGSYIGVYLIKLHNEKKVKSNKKEMERKIHSLRLAYRKTLEQAK